MRKIKLPFIILTALLLLFTTACSALPFDVSFDTSAFEISIGVSDEPDTHVSDESQTQVSEVSNDVSDDVSCSEGGGFLGEYSIYGIDLCGIPEYSGDPYSVICETPPVASLATTKSYETYGALDSLGRCTACISCIGRDLMPTEERGAIGMVKPTGWQTVKYDCVDGRYLYNRCHLIGYQLTGENANTQNLITGTRYMNVQGMLPFEDLTADYIKETNNHVMYRVTPIFIGVELLARGVLMEGYSVEDEGDGISFCVFVYNVQPTIEINYSDGSSIQKQSEGEIKNYILNTNSHKFHLPTCSGAASISDKNRQEYTGSREALIAQGYTPCSICNP